MDCHLLYIVDINLPNTDLYTLSVTLPIETTTLDIQRLHEDNTKFYLTIDYYSITTPSIGMISTLIDSKSKVLSIYDDNSAWYSMIDPQFTKNFCKLLELSAMSSILIYKCHVIKLLGTRMTN